MSTSAVVPVEEDADSDTRTGQDAPFLLFLFLAAHVPLAYAMRQSRTVATLHTLATLFLGLAYALRGCGIERFAYLAAYITGAEVLWRMTKSQVFWESGKYGVCLVLMTGMYRGGLLNFPRLPLVYLGLLAPSVAALDASRGLEGVKDQVSFNLSGPLSLTVCLLFFSQLAVPRREFLRLLVSALGPAVGIAFVGLFRTMSLESIQFRQSSNFATSGGFGPNQVSAALGMGVLFCLIFLLIGRSGSLVKALMLLILTGLAVQCAMTFSRGGLAITTASAIAGSLALARDSGTRVKIVVVSALLYLVGNYLILPSLDQFTGGALSKRFTETKLTGRDSLAWGDIYIWQENPLLGVGPGGGGALRGAEFSSASARDAHYGSHTEYTRLLSEHGLFGLVAIGVLGAISVGSVARSPTKSGQAVAMVFVCWGLLYMAINGMRMVAPAFILGLSSATLLLDEG